MSKGKESASVAKDLIRMLSSVQESDLAELDQQIADKQASIAELVKSTEGELKALLAMRKMLDLKLNGPKERKQRQPKGEKSTNGASQKKPGSESGYGPLSDKIAGLLEFHGDLGVHSLMSKLGVSAQAINMSITKSGDRFEFDEQERVWRLK